MLEGQLKLNNKTADGPKKAIVHTVTKIFYWNFNPLWTQPVLKNYQTMKENSIIVFLYFMKCRVNILSEQCILSWGRSVAWVGGGLVHVTQRKLGRRLKMLNPCT